MASVWWWSHLVNLPAPGNLQWKTYVHWDKKQSKVGERQQLLRATHYKGTGNLSICRTLSGNYSPFTGLLNSSLSASLQGVTRMQREQIFHLVIPEVITNFRETEMIMMTWLHRKETGREEHCALCRRNSLIKNPGSWEQKEINCVSELRITCVWD